MFALKGQKDSSVLSMAAHIPCVIYIVFVKSTQKKHIKENNAGKHSLRKQ